MIGVCGLILLIISTTAVMGRFYRRRLATQLSGTDLSGSERKPLVLQYLTLGNSRKTRLIPGLEMNCSLISAEVIVSSSGGSYPSDSTVPSIQTVGERRFYVVPENQISVIEAPPCYDDALKHPAVRRFN